MALIRGGVGCKGRTIDTTGHINNPDIYLKIHISNHYRQRRSLASWMACSVSDAVYPVSWKDNFRNYMANTGI